MFDDKKNNTVHCKIVKIPFQNHEKMARKKMFIVSLVIKKNPAIWTHWFFAFFINALAFQHIFLLHNCTYHNHPKDLWLLIGLLPCSLKSQKIAEFTKTCNFEYWAASWELSPLHILAVSTLRGAGSSDHFV
jgi:hypothetical protein